MQPLEGRVRHRLPIGLSTWVGWVLLTLFGMRWASDGSPKPLIEGLTHSVSWNLVMAVAWLAFVTWRMQWHDLRFVAPKPPRSLWLLWFPALYLVFFGLLFMALLLRTGSLWVPVTYHALWDLGTFLVSASGASKGSSSADLSQGWTWAVPLLLVLPNFLYAMYLLRNVRNKSP